MRTKKLPIEYQNKVSNFPNFDKSGSIRGMKKTLLRQRCIIGAVWKLYL